MWSRVKDDVLIVDKTVDVFLFLGQSNMLGVDRPGFVTDSVDRTDTLFWRSQGGAWPTLIPFISWSDMVIGSTGVETQGSSIGPEIAFVDRSKVLTSTYSQPQAILKFAVSGSSLHTDWNATRRLAPEDGYLYLNLLNIIDASLQALTDDGYAYNIKGAVWLQGESDISQPHLGNYQTNLDDLISGIRTHLNKPALPFVLIGIVPTTAQAPINTILQNYAYTDSHIGYITEPTAGAWTLFNNKHYDHAAFLDIGVAVADEMVLAINGTTATAVSTTLMVKQDNVLFSNAILNQDYTTTNTTDQTLASYLNPDIHVPAFYTPYRQSNGKLKFKLIYPDIPMTSQITGVTAPWELTWEQTSIPTANQVVGYNALDTPTDYDVRFGGLDTSHQSYSYMSGTQTGAAGDIWSGVGVFRYFQGTYLGHLGGQDPNNHPSGVGSRLPTNLELYLVV